MIRRPSTTALAVASAVWLGGSLPPGPGARPADARPIATDALVDQADRAKVRHRIGLALQRDDCSHARLLVLRLLKTAADRAEVASLHLDMALVERCAGNPSEEARHYQFWLDWASGHDRVDPDFHRKIIDLRNRALDAAGRPGLGFAGPTTRQLLALELDGQGHAVPRSDQSAAIGWMLGVGLRIGPPPPPPAVDADARAAKDAPIAEDAEPPHPATTTPLRAEVGLAVGLEQSRLVILRVGGAWASADGHFVARAAMVQALGDVSGPGAVVGVGFEPLLGGDLGAFLAIDAAWWLQPSQPTLTLRIGVTYAF